MLYVPLLANISLYGFGLEILDPYILCFFSITQSDTISKFCFLIAIIPIMIISFDEDELDNDFITKEGYKTENYTPGWALELLSFSSDLNALADTFNSGPHFYKEIFTKCIDDIKYDTMIRTTDNQLVSLSDINNVIT